ncbi:RHO1 GDP-GTP exchange protein 2 [Linnemannia zychae]|nr:RHO1 GDP-GTP exchange protein 2 [Linnemannia zychae]
MPPWTTLVPPRFSTPPHHFSISIRPSTSQTTTRKLAQVSEHGPIEPRQSFQLNIRNQDGSMADIQQDVSSLNISSPPRSRPHDSVDNLTSQQLPVNAFNPLQSSQRQQQSYQNYLSQEQQQQHHQHSHPYNESHAYPQPSPTTSSASKLYRTSTGSSTTHTSWSQPSSPGFPPQSFNGHLHESIESNEPVYISEAAHQLIDFNPSILSTIAVAFREKMLQNESKRLESVNYDLEFPCTFTGKETVDVIVELTKVEDRRHALAIARSLEDQQLFFGGGTLYDSNNDLYFFTEHTLAYIPGKSEFPAVPVGVFPHSSRCYSYDCQPGRPPCYSYLCPNRQSISSMLGRTNSDMSTVTSTQEKVWANSVPPSVVAAASKKERNRQEAIFEVINTEQNYIRDLELLEEIFINPLMAGNIVSPDKLQTLIEDVFLNFKEILELNKLLLADLRARQEQQPLVESIGDVFLPHIAGFEQAYSRYIPRIALSEFAYKKEAAHNPTFKAFLDTCTRHPEARRLGLRHFIGQPYQRIPRYPLLLSEVVKRTEEDVPDRATVQEVIKVCTELGKRIDSCMPEGNRQLRLLNIQDKIIWKSGEVHQDLKLSEKGRKFHFEAVVKRRSNLDVQMIEIRLFLFDHMIMMTKEKRDKQGDKENMLYQVSKKPIPLELVQVLADDGKPLPAVNARGDPAPGRKLNNSTKSTGSGHRHSAFIAPHDIRVGFQETKYVAPVTIEHRGRKGGIYTVYMTAKDRDEFLEQMAIAQARRQAVSGSHLFKMQVITHYNAAPPLPSSNLVHNPMDGCRSTCSTPYLNVLDGKRRVVIGTEEGVYVGMEDDPYSFRLALRELHVSQVSVLESYHMLLVLTGKVLKAFNLSCLDPNSDKSLQVGQSLGKSVQFFSAGTCAGKTLVITMKRKNGGESHFSAYEPVENAVLGGHHRGGFSLSSFKSSKSDWFKLYREFYVGTDSTQLQMLAKMVCVVCPKGFEVVILENLNNTQEFPNRHDEAYSFLEARHGSTPVSMFKINADEFLMCYTDFAFTMTKKGELAKRELIEWEGRPESFALAPPYIIAFEAGLIEIRHIETGALEQIILGNNIRRLYSNVEIKKEPNNAVIQLVMSDPNNPESRQVVKMVRVPHPFKQPIEYQPKSPYIHPRQQQYYQENTMSEVPYNIRLAHQQQQHSSPTPSHLMSPALQPVLSTNGSGPAVLATHTHHHVQQQQQYHQHTTHQQQTTITANGSNSHHGHQHTNNNGLSSHPVQHFNPHHQYQQQTAAAPPIPTRPSPRLSQLQQPVHASYPMHPYEPPTQPYPMVMVDRKESNGGSAGDHQQQQQQQQGGGGGHAISWSSGGYP